MDNTHDTAHSAPDAKREAYMYDFAAWLHADVLMATDDEVPPFRISFGKAPGMRESRKYKVLGACMPRAASTDGVNEIFLDITTDEATIDDKALTLTVMETFVHEYCHAIDDCQSGHGGAFAKLARSLNLVGPLTATTAGPELKEALNWYLENRGTLPTGAIRTNKRVKPKQGTRMIKVSCRYKSGCGFHFRTSAAQIEKLREDSTCPACRQPSLSW